jgi:hypothetical protein
VRGGSGWAQFRRRRAEGWTGSSRGARGGGEGVVCGWNLSGVKWLLRIPARSTSGLRWRKEEESSPMLQSGCFGGRSWDWFAR